MLVLSRKLGEKLHIGDDVTITVTLIKGNRVKLGIEAPDHVRIVRGELKPITDEFRAPAPTMAYASSAYLESVH